VIEEGKRVVDALRPQAEDSVDTLSRYGVGRSSTVP